ncbi:MAG: DNA translocase FtsK [Bacteroidia bacterium]|nr:DNA translocase FtsK [Bacteroidia bacterium]
MSFLQNLKSKIALAVSFYRNEKTQKVLGLGLILAGVYLFIAFTSFVFTWETDQDKVMGPGADFFNPDLKVNNWLGKLGALISNLFIHKWFGVSSFFLVPLFFGMGLKKLFAREIPFLRNLKRRMIFFLVWGSLCLGFFFTQKFVWLGGGFGFIMNQQLQGLVGNAGVLALLGVSMLVFLVIAFNISFLKAKTTENAMNEAEKEFVEEDDKKIIPIQTANKLNAEKNNEDELNLSKEEEEQLLQFEVKKNTPENKEEDETEKKDNVVEFNMVQEEVKEPVAKKTGEVDVTIEELKTDEILNDDDIDKKAKKLVEECGEFDPTLELSSYQFPTLDLLIDYGKGEAKVSQEEFALNTDKIVATLRNYGIEIDKIKVTPGPTVTLYEIVPAAGVRISKIKNLEDDIALSLSALGIRIIAPIPGKGTIGIEVPNLHPEMVPMRNILASEKFQNSTFDLPIALGKTISNETYIADLAKMPHLLMAGATGQGKSVGLNAVLVSLLYKKHPSQIKFVLIDPKKVELTLFNKIERHFLAKLPNAEDAIITDTTKVVHTLNSLCIEMDNRYELLKDAQVKNIKEYNPKFVARRLNPELGHKYLPYIVVVIDEFADLIMTAGKEVEMPIARIAQLARAVGIHLIIATQRPSVNIITGTIKANFPARVAFRVTSKIDSRTILDSGGADQLIGRGDMLLSTGSDLIRIQCAFVDTPEVERICEFIGSQRAYPSAHMLPEFIDENASSKEIDLADRDSMFDEAAHIVVQHQQGSASLLQRKLKLGYNRAGRIVDQLEAAGIIGKFEGSKAREVLIKDLISLEQFLKDIGGKKD